MSTEKKVINPKYLEGYIYNIDLSNNENVVVKIKIPANLSKDNISVKYNASKYGVVVGVKDEIPFLSGVCFEEVSNFKYNFLDQGYITLIFAKKDPSIQWPILIKEPISKKNNLDPLSALTLALQNLMIGNEAGQMFLAYSAECMFPPAIIQYATFLIQNRVSCDPLIPSLFKCVDEYNFGPAGTMIGNLSIIGQISFDTAFPYVKKSAVELNDPNAKFLYACFLSPLETPHGRFEDGDEAYKVLEEIEKDNPLARFGFARLIREGIGCEKDEAKANELLESARKENPEVPTFEEADLLEKQEQNPKKTPKPTPTPTSNVDRNAQPPKKEESGGLLSKIAIAGTVCLFAAAAGYTIYQNFARRK